MLGIFKPNVKSILLYRLVIRSQQFVFALLIFVKHFRFLSDGRLIKVTFCMYLQTKRGLWTIPTHLCAKKTLNFKIYQDLGKRLLLYWNLLQRYDQYLNGKLLPRKKMSLDCLFISKTEKNFAELKTKNVLTNWMNVKCFRVTCWWCYVEL